MTGLKKDVVLTKQSHSVWASRRDISLAILGWLAVIIIFFWLLGHISHTLFLLVIAAFLAYALVPAVRFFERFLSRFFAILVLYLLVFIGLGIVFYEVANTAIQQFTMLAHDISISLSLNGHNTLSPLVVTMKRFGISQQLALIGEQLTTYAESFTSTIIPFLTSIVTIISDLLIIAVLSIYLLNNGQQILMFIRSNTPTTEQRRLEFLLHTLRQVVGGYIRGQLLLSALIGFLVGICMGLFHVPYAVLLGVLVFILEFIPFLGVFVSGAICVLLALTKGWLIALFVLVYFIVIHQVEGNILWPRIVGKALGLNPLISILALIAGIELYGIMGALFAPPVAGVVQAVLVALWSEWKSMHPKSFAEGKHTFDQQKNKKTAKKSGRKRDASLQ